MHSSNSLLYVVLFVFLVFCQAPGTVSFRVGALQTLIGCDQDNNDVDKWLHETDESGGRGQVQQLRNFAFTKQVMFHTSQQYRIFCLSVTISSHSQKGFVEGRTLKHIDPVGRLNARDSSYFLWFRLLSKHGSLINKKMK